MHHHINHYHNCDHLLIIYISVVIKNISLSKSLSSGMTSLHNDGELGTSISFHYLSEWNESSLPMLPLSSTSCWAICMATTKILPTPTCKSFDHEICYEPTYQLTNLVFLLPMATLASTRTCMFPNPSLSSSILPSGVGFCSHLHLFSCKINALNLDWTCPHLLQYVSPPLVGIRPLHGCYL